MANGQSFVGRLNRPLCEVTGQRKDFSPQELLFEKI